MIFKELVMKVKLKEEKILSKTKKEVVEWLAAIIIGVVIVTIVRMFIATNYEVVGKSMMPTFSDHDKVIVNKLSPINRMDIIIFHGAQNEDYVKRVIGIPGDTIKYENDELFINNKKVEEPFLETFEAYKNPEENFTEDFELSEVTGSKTVPPNRYFVLGDNRMSSLDSRYFHFIEKNEIIGEVKVRYWPISRFTFNFYSE